MLIKGKTNFTKKYPNYMESFLEKKKESKIHRYYRVNENWILPIILLAIYFLSMAGIFKLCLS